MTCNFSLGAFCLLLLPTSHLCPFESRNHYSNDDPLSLSLSRPIERPSSDSELFSPAGTKKRHCGIDSARRGRTEKNGSN